jgi:N-(2-amino-2-carboxyethyl)-L-glutamate synthase
MTATQDLERVTTATENVRPAIVVAPEEFNVPDLYVDLGDLLGAPLYLKCEHMNFAGSIKLKTARSMVDRAEREGHLHRGDVLVESSSGNLGVALSVVAASRGYGFICVTDVRCCEGTIALMRALGAEVIVVADPHPERGLLGTRIDLVQKIASSDDHHVWLNQYVNTANPEAHSTTTAPEMLAAFPQVARVFVGVGTSGTAMGIADYFRRQAPHVRLVGVDSVGSVTFGGPASPRHIPGLGAAVPPPIYRQDALDEHLYVPEAQTLRMCRELSARGFIMGGSTGTVLAGARRWLEAHPEASDTVSLAIAPDGGERYLATLYDESWVAERFGGELLGRSAAWTSAWTPAADAATTTSRR